METFLACYRWICTHRTQYGIVTGLLWGTGLYVFTHDLVIAVPCALAFGIVHSLTLKRPE